MIANAYGLLRNQSFSMSIFIGLSNSRKISLSCTFKHFSLEFVSGFVFLDDIISLSYRM